MFLWSITIKWNHFKPKHFEVLWINLSVKLFFFITINNSDCCSTKKFIPLALSLYKWSKYLASFGVFFFHPSMIATFLLSDIDHICSVSCHIFDILKYIKVGSNIVKLFAINGCFLAFNIFLNQSWMV